VRKLVRNHLEIMTVRGPRAGGELESFKSGIGSGRRGGTLYKVIRK
jgi:hypothetical protein